MNASEENRCPRCGAVVPTSSTEELCPACLLSGALAPYGDQTETMTAPAGATSLPNSMNFPYEFGGYRLLSMLGRGGMGVVYEAEELATGRRIALKVLGQQLDTPDMRQRFLREGRLAARVNHPNSLYIFGSEEIDGFPVITMEIAGSGTLKDRLKNTGPLPVAEAVDAILDVICGIETAFAAGVLHRDIKPSNCFVCPDGSVKVGDFGLSVSTMSKTDTFVTVHGKIMGTPAFASPEQLRGDSLDVRSDIYSVGATLFALLTDRAPFEGENAVQVVANAVNQKPVQLTELREDIPPGLARVVDRCLAKEPDGRYANYAELRNALSPFGSKGSEPASITLRASSGWIDFLVAFLPVYVILMFLVGSEELLVKPLVERTLYSARYYFLLLGVGLLYFSLFEGLWGAGLGKWLKGLRVVRSNGSSPGFWRALIRVLIPIVCVEGVRMPITMTFISDTDWTGFQTAMYVVVFIICGWIPVLLALRALPENSFTTVWDLASGTRVVVKPRGTVRPLIEVMDQPVTPAGSAELLGPFQIVGELIPSDWLIGVDPVLHRQVWLLRRSTAELSLARRDVARPGRLRWLQKVEIDGTTWDVFEAIKGMPFSTLIESGKRIPWSTLRHWLHDLALELWEATGDQTLPSVLSLDQVWITAEGRAVLLDEAWPDVSSPSTNISVRNIAGQQRFLQTIAACVETTSVPLHARPVLKNLKDGKFEKLSFLTGTLRGLLEKPVEVSGGIRFGSIFLLPLYVWIAIVVGRYHDKPWNNPLEIIVVTAQVVLAVIAIIQLAGLPFRTTVSQTIFKLAVVNARGERATRWHLLIRWAIVWLPLFVPMFLFAWLGHQAEGDTFILLLVLIFLWIGAAIRAVVHPHRGLHDGLANTWVVRR